MKTSEGVIKDKIRAWLREQGAYVFSPTQQGYGQQTVDLLACMDGQFCAYEVKRDAKAKPTARQIAILKEIKKAGGHAMVVWGLQGGELIGYDPTIS